MELLLLGKGRLMNNLPEDALLCEPGELRTVYQKNYVCPFCHKAWVELTFLGIALDEYAVDGSGFVRRGFASLDQTVELCPCGVFWLGDPMPFRFSTISAEVNREQQIRRTFRSHSLN